MSAPTITDAAPEVGQLVRVRGQQWVVTSVHRSSQQRDELSPTPLPRAAMARLTSVSDDDLGDERDANRVRGAKRLTDGTWSRLDEARRVARRLEG